MKQVLDYFENHYKVLKDAILKATVYPAEPDQEVCKKISEGLYLLAENGNKKAAALYVLIAVYDKDSDIFSRDKAGQLLVDIDALEEYYSLLDEELFSPYEEECDDFYVFPTLLFLKI